MFKKLLIQICSSCERVSSPSYHRRFALIRKAFRSVYGDGGVEVSCCRQCPPQPSVSRPLCSLPSSPQPGAEAGLRTKSHRDSKQRDGKHRTFKTQLSGWITLTLQSTPTTDTGAWPYEYPCDVGGPSGFSSECSQPKRTQTDMCSECLCPLQLRC